MASSTDDYLIRGGEIVDRCRELDRIIARAEAEKAALLGERVDRLLAEVPPGSAGYEAAERSMFAEVSSALHITRGAAARALGIGWALQTRFPQTRASLASGEISARHAAMIVTAAAPFDLSDADAHQRFEQQVVPFAEAETAARTEAFAKSVAAAVSPETIVERHRRARGDRRITVTDLYDGMSLFTILIPTPLAHAAYDRVTAIGRQVSLTRAAQDGAAFEGPSAPQPGEELTDEQYQRLAGFGSMFADLAEPLTDARKLDEIRADIATDLLLAARSDSLIESGLDSIRGTVQVTIAGSTLAARDDRPAEHDGHGPIAPDLARRLAGTAHHWERLFLDPTGMLTRTDSYAPTERMRRHLRARDRHCRFPGCRMPAGVCEIDHNHDHAKGGATDLGNLCCLCTGHHALKHPDNDLRWRWSAVQSPGGVVTWISPEGRVYDDVPPPRVQFV